MTRLEFLQERLKNIETAIDTIITTGKSYSIGGSHTVTQADLTDLERIKKDTLREIALLNGNAIKKTVFPEFR